MPPQIQFYDETDSAPVTTLYFTGVVPGSASSTQEIHVWNQLGGTTADDAIGVRLRPKAETAAGSGVFVGQGVPALDERWLEVRVVGGDGITPTLTAWTPIGAGAYFDLPNLPRDCAVHLEFRLNPPQGTSGTDIRFLIVVESALTTPLDQGRSEAGCDGVLRWIGDSAKTELLVGSPYSESSPVGASIECGYEAWVSAGLPWAVPAEQVAISSADGAAASLASGEEYRAVVSLSPAGTRAVTKGLKAAAGDAVAPAVPAGHVPRAEILRGFDGLVNNSDITMLSTAGRYSLAWSGLVGTLGPGEALVDNRLLPNTGIQQVTFAANETNRVWLQPSGLLDLTTDAAPPVPRALLIWEVETDGSSVVAVTDRRLFVGGEVRRIPLRLSGSLTDDAVSPHEVAEDVRPWLLDPERSVVVSLGTLGSGNSGGESRFDVELSEAGATYASIFSGDDDMPAVAYDATEPTTRACQPTTLQVPAGARIRARVDGTPSGGGTMPDGALVVLQGVVR